MKIGDLVKITRTTSGGGRVRRPVVFGEIGVLVQTHYIANLSSTCRLWCDLMMADGLLTVPGWCISKVEAEDETD